MSTSATQSPTDDVIAARLRAIAGDLNHWLHVAYHHGLFVQITPVTDPVLRMSEVCVMRPVLPSPPTTDPGKET
jgi:hypothetical protein